MLRGPSSLYVRPLAITLSLDMYERFASGSLGDFNVAAKPVDCGSLGPGLPVGSGSNSGLNENTGAAYYSVVVAQDALD